MLGCVVLKSYVAVTLFQSLSYVNSQNNPTQPNHMVVGVWNIVCYTMFNLANGDREKKGLQ